MSRKARTFTTRTVPPTPSLEAVVFQSLVDRRPTRNSPETPKRKTIDMPTRAIASSRPAVAEPEQDGVAGPMEEDVERRTLSGLERRG